MINSKKYFLGIDIGGSHISAAIITDVSGEIVNNKVYETKIDSTAPAFTIIDSWRIFIEGILEQNKEISVSGIGFAIPGPFDYQRGISQITGVQKYESIFGFDIRQSFQYIQEGVKLPIKFINDAAGFAIGEYVAGAAQNSSRTIVVTLGTGFGSTFLIDGVPQTIGEGVPELGFLYHYPVGDSIADDYFSTRWFTNNWFQKTDKEIKGVKELAEKARNNDPISLAIFNEFAESLGDFISYWFGVFSPDTFVIGGNISKAADLFLAPLQEKLNDKGFSNVKIKIAQLEDKAPIIGAAMTVSKELDNKNDKHTNKRNTSQFLIPEKVNHTTKGNYNIYPAFPIGKGKIQEGCTPITKWILKHKTVVIDGYMGVLWDNLISNIHTELVKSGKNIAWIHVDAAAHDEKYINTLVEPYLGGDDPLFGKITDKELIDWLDTDKLNKLQPADGFDINILVGTGAALVGWDAPLMYIDVPKNELQYRMRAGQVFNLGVTSIQDMQQAYKRMYFVDWKVLDKHKCNILPKIELLVDEQRIDTYLSISGDDLRAGLAAMAHNYFRVRPWFQPGVWGGNWMMEHIEGLSPDVPNLAWSLELMVLENGLLFESDSYMLEVSFDFLMYNGYKEILGDAADRFKYDFPIRFNFLDTFAGQNLSVQCHPKPEYIKEKFGMPFTQDETYYILDCKEDAKVYLGFQEGIDPDKFKQALVTSQEKAEMIDVDKYVQSFIANKHDLYLIPSGTIHASGINNLVLEISSAPYIFTFKMYDWMRLDLDGKPRPINIKHGLNNVDFKRQGKVVEDELISSPYVVEQTPNYILEHVPTHKDHFYDVYRYHFDKEIQVKTDNKCHICMLVEGSSVTLKSQNGMEQLFNYAETFVIPAAAQSYTITNNGDTPAVLVKVFVK